MTHDLHLPGIAEYCAQHTSPEAGVLYRLNRETHLKALRPQMLSGQEQGVFLSMISNLMKPMHVLEIGTYTGYSAICLAQGVQQGGKLLTMDVNEELAIMAKKHWEDAGLSSVIEFLHGKAAEILPTLDGPFDLVFIDADKANYLTYYELVIPNVRKGGWIIADNVLWYGNVVDETQQDKDTQAIRAFNTAVQADPRVRNVLLPLRDGLMLMEKV